jgi:endonuclease/exonuclease/phosphatase family metal-dependent hydrolase
VLHPTKETLEPVPTKRAAKTATKTQERVPGEPHLRIATYNIHKCRGLDGRVRPQRILEVLHEIDADLIALQEVVSRKGRVREADQAQYFAEELGYHCAIGENRTYRGGGYGNVVLTRFPIQSSHNYDLSISGCEPRGGLSVDVKYGAATLHIFNVHMGTAIIERRRQARRLLEEILEKHEISGARIVLGDFNEWTRGLASRLLVEQFHTAEPRRYLGRARAYPGLLPLLHLDRIYFDHALKLRQLSLHRSRKALVASDHLPLVADLTLHSSATGHDSVSMPNDAEEQQFETHRNPARELRSG